MSAPQATWILSVCFPDDLLCLNRAVGILRRQSLPVSNVALGPTGRPGTLRLSCALAADRATAERTANALRKMTEAREVTLHAEADCVMREHLLVRVRVPPTGLSALLDTVSLFQATIVEERPDELLLEATGTSPFMVSFLRALEPFGMIDLVRGASLALPLPTGRAVGDSSRLPAAPSRNARAVPA
ncbi:MAG TPA: acetolactate synthase small subunit [Gemmatimonadales bacterium]|nr:acetolactate synthase small subunit [Gemmatimonadales bacterium]